MKAISTNSLKNNTNQFLLLAIGTALIAIHLTLVWRSEDINLFFNSILFWMAVSSFVGEKRSSLNLDSGITSSILGVLIIVFSSLRISSLTPSINNIWLTSFPFFSALGLALMASGVKGLKQYQKELMILFFLITPRLLILLLPTIDLSIVTAKFSTIILWYTGFQIVQSGVTISFPEVGKGIEVYPGCSGTEQIIQILGIAILFISMFPLYKWQKILAPILAATLAFMVNAARVALMAIFVARGNNNLFEYWHTGNGSQLFPVFTTLLFGCFCWFFFLRNEQENQDYTQV
ncbi:cyanoexosortase A [Calothrix sp. PCC 7507]|uniref:cyanoexosortase A n=1 Tax=Calothrix sp. PCC 7507 TaxID=99598 RepID=UPI00029EEECD|nr:cyanoexosortase A [Calothrix sp. PCC 7507]AFY34354.1 Exosortase EpsH-related protein [Calothrix sp. PCC 7507]